MQRAISKSQWLFRGTRSAPWVTHTKTGAERATSGPAQGGNEQLRASVVFFLKISLPLLRAAQVLIQQGCSPCMTRGATALWAPSQGGISFISDSILSSSFKPFPFTVTVCCGAAAPALEGAWSQWEPEVLQLCRGSLKFVHSKGCSVWNFFSEWWFSKRGTNKAKKPPQSLPALLQRPFLGRAGPWPPVQQKNWPEPCPSDCACVVEPLQCSWEPPAQKTLRDTEQRPGPWEGKGQPGVSVPGAMDCEARREIAGAIQEDLQGQRALSPSTPLNTDRALGTRG